MSSATWVESSIVIEARYGSDGLRDFDRLMARIAVEIVSVDLEQARAAREAFRRFGKGRHPAELNVGDCFSYALARPQARTCQQVSRTAFFQRSFQRLSSDHVRYCWAWRVTSNPRDWLARIPQSRRKVGGDV